jgi:hypothetical protein
MALPPPDLVQWGGDLCEVPLAFQKEVSISSNKPEKSKSSALDLTLTRESCRAQSTEGPNALPTALAFFCFHC